MSGNSTCKCVLSVAQAYEVFFSHFLYVQLIYRPFAKDNRRDPRLLNELTKQLYDRVEKFTFEPMRRLVLRLAVDRAEPSSIADAQAAIDALPESERDVPQVPRQDIAAVDEDRLRALLKHLQDADAGKLRNQVVHKNAHRPKRDEAKRALDEAQVILHGLTGLFRLGYDANWYTGKAGR